MTIPNDSAARGDAGLSVLEMLVALAVCAMVVGVIAASLQGRQTPTGASFAQIAAFIEDSRIKTMLSGEATVITVGSDRLSLGNDSVVWDPAKVRLSTGPSNAQSLSGLRLVLFPDGTVLGPGLLVHDDAGDHAVLLPTRMQ